MQQKQNKEEKIGSVVLLVFALVFLGSAFLIGQPVVPQQLGPDAFPKAIGFLLVALSGVYVFQQFRGGTKEDEARAAIIGADEKVEDKIDIKTMGSILGLMIIYAALFEPLGYAITTFLVFTSGCWVLDRKHMVRDVIIAFIASFVLYFVFSLVLRVNLPGGPLRLLGL